MELTSKYSQPSLPVEFVGHIVLVVAVVLISAVVGTAQILSPGGIVMVFTGTIALRWYLWGDARTRQIAAHILAIVAVGLGLIAISEGYWQQLPELTVGAVGVYLAGRYLLRFLRAIERIAAALDDD